MRTITYLSSFYNPPSSLLSHTNHPIITHMALYYHQPLTPLSPTCFPIIADLPPYYHPPVSLISVDSRNFEMWGQFPPMSKKCGGLVNKNGHLYLRQRGINFGSTCLSVSLLAGLHKCYCMDLCEKNRRWKLIQLRSH